MRILLACNAGMSTSMIVSKMEEIVQKNRSYTSINNGNWFDSGSGC